MTQGQAPSPSSRQDGVPVHFRIPSDCNIVYTFHTKTVSHPTNSTLLCLCDKPTPHKSCLAKPRMATNHETRIRRSCLSKKNTPMMLLKE
ncbi:hypothetical protein VNO80_03276 [Phaseolus coccineus]|uniref:Uncharacterized protein n=1 Tax=Phaseolus coccineus TaxID=3886 RepID=A0AAN9NYD7_PHACN